MFFENTKIATIRPDNFTTIIGTFCKRNRNILDFGLRG